MERQKFRTKLSADYEDQLLRLGFLDLFYSPVGIALNLAEAHRLQVVIRPLRGKPEKIVRDVAMKERLKNRGGGLLSGHHDLAS